MSDAGPEIAVVVGAYSRATYVREAVRSGLDQTLPRDRVELVVTKNFREDDLDAALARDGVRTIFDDTSRIGPWLLAAIRSTRAPIVTMLDDDDRYAPARLARVLEVFRTHPEVGLYRNRVDVIDGNGRAVPPAEWSELWTDPYFDTHGPVYVPPSAKAHVVDLLFRETNASFNSSTMAFRREILDGRRGEHFAATRLPDSSFLLNALVTPAGVYLDDRRLTGYRIHPAKVTRATGWLRWAVESNRGFGAEATEFGRPDLAAYYEATAVHFDRLLRSGELVDRIADGAPKREVAGRATDYARFLAGHAAERSLSMDVWAAEAYAAAYLMSPSLAQRVQRRRAVRRGAPGA
jgi:glycosyltransferase involved in cell wall biosynthesis